MKHAAKNVWIPIFWVFLMLGGQSSSAYADTELENETLFRIRHVLNALTPLINEAEQAQDKNTRVQFRYDWLRSDIEKIKQGLDQKQHMPSIQPRTIQPIKGDYVTLNSIIALKSQQR